MLHRLSSPPSLTRTRSRTPSRPERAERAETSSNPVREPGWKKAAKWAVSVGSAYSALAVPALAQEPQPDLSCQVVILDYFEGPKSHGEAVSLAAKSQDPSIETVDIELAPIRNNAGRFLQRESRDHNWTLRSRTASQEDLAEAFEAKVELKITSGLDVVSSGLEYATARGFVNSVANVSRGLTEFQTAKQLYGEAGRAWVQTDPRLRRYYSATTAGYARLFSLDAAKLMSPEPSVNKEERDKLRQAIVDRVHAVNKESPTVQRARGRWSTAVGKFEANRNSVILAAGNDGNEASSLEADPAIMVPTGFFDNQYDDGQVTSVGATVWIDSKEYVANYSTQSEGIDIYANGTVEIDGEKQYGTSFAAPRVAAAASRVHCSNPNLSSADVEAYLLANQTRETMQPD